MEHPAQFQQLFFQFQQNYLAVEGFGDLAAYIEIRNSAYRNFTYLRERMADGEDCTDLILRTLLPYTDTANNRWLGAWTHLAPAVPGNIRRWYGTAGRMGEEDWPIVADAIWRFVNRAVALSDSQTAPDSLAKVCVEFNQLTVTSGFQMGMMTPILNALYPEQFHLVNNRTRNVLQYFTGTSFPASLLAYPDVNRSISEYLGSVTTLIPPFDESGTHPGDVFERFCYWLVAVRRYSLRPARNWLVAAGEDSWQWEEWKDGGFVAVGWDELGDLSGIKKAEFVARRDSLLAQYNNWTKTGTDVAWRFARQLQEGDQVVVLSDEQRILGYGTVTGGYYYAPELPQGHRVPIQWIDIQGRTLPSGIEVTKPLMELTSHQFRAIERTSIQTETVIIPPRDKSVPFFVKHFAPLLRSLRQQTEGVSTAQLVAELAENAKQTMAAEDGKLDHGTGDHDKTKRSVKTIATGQSASSIHRARHYLCNAGLIESLRRGHWRVTVYGQAISLDEAEMERIYHEVEYRRRVEESLLHESSIIRRLTESSTTYATGGHDAAGFNAGEVNSASSSGAANRTRQDFHLSEVGQPLSSIVSPDVSGSQTEAPKHSAASSNLQLPYSLTECALETGFSESELSLWMRTLLRKRQIVLFGPSGTGKTYMAHHLARHLCSGTDGFAELIQFHPGYAYEDFIQGLRPNSEINRESNYHGNSGPPFIMKPGRFLDFCQRAKQRQGPAVLIIDEINRANLARVFGELMYLLEYRDAEAILAGSGEHFQIPQNVYLIGTMNTADRSVSLIDHALRRRFGFIELRPNYEVLRHYHQQQKSAFDVEPLIRLLVQINQSIGNPHYALGITYFLTPTLATDLPDIWQTEIEPALAERFFDMPEQMEQYQWIAVEKKIKW